MGAVNTASTVRLVNIHYRCWTHHGHDMTLILTRRSYLQELRVSTQIEKNSMKVLSSTSSRRSTGH